MLKTIAEVSPVLLSFIEELELPLSRPQKRHIAQVADALITTEGSKTLSALYRSIVGDPLILSHRIALSISHPEWAVNWSQLVSIASGS
jgi:hypothetical protein